MRLESSCEIAASILNLTATTYEIAYETDEGHLALYSSSGVTTDTYKIMRAGTRPSLSAFTVNAATSIQNPRLIVTEFVVAYQTDEGILDYNYEGISDVSTGGTLPPAPPGNGFRYLP